MPRLVLATKNKGKLRELQELLKGTGWELVSLDRFPQMPPVEEDKETFEANAVKKAVVTGKFTGTWVLADDSGLEVDALNGEPGVHSARYAGKHGDDVANNQRLLEELTGVPLPERTARFRCVVALVSPQGRYWTTQGVCEGRIGFAARGDQGFGYDPLFVLASGQTMAELPEDEKNQLSHRGHAMQKMRELLVKLANDQDWENF